MGYLLCYISQALNKKWVNVNKAHNIPVTIYLSLFIKNQLEHLNYLALIVVIIFFVKSLYHSQLESSPSLKRGARIFQKLSHLRGYQRFCYTGGIKRGVDVEMGGWGGVCRFVITLQFKCIYCVCVCVCVCAGEGGGRQVSFITF